MTQNQAKGFSSGLEFASLLGSSGHLPSLCELISNLYAERHSNQNLFWKKVSYDDRSGLTVLTFGTTQNHFQPDLVPFSNTDDNPFKFICSKTNPNFSLNHSAFSLFKQYQDQLDQLKSEMDLKNTVIVTGHGVGGSIASLFTLWLLEKMDPRSEKRPLCITFGSPLIGDQNFHKAMWQSSNWNSCFLHVASLQDPLVASSISNITYTPFGTFLLCSDNGSSCLESPVSVMRLLNLTSQLNQGLQQNCDYGSIVENLDRKVIYKDFDMPNIPLPNERKVSITFQLWALGLYPQLMQENNMKNLVKDLDSEEERLIQNKRKRFVPNKRLDLMKINMTKLEWYKKKSKTEDIGYYNRFKNDAYKEDQDVVGFIKELDMYWKEMVEEVEKQPQKEGAVFRTRWLGAGTNYRRMVEPLDIARYYRQGKRDYINKERSEHYRKLEEWLEDEKNEPGTAKKNVQSLLTLDSCFWAHVEEAVILTQKLEATEYNEVEKQEAMKSLDKFEKDVYKSLRKYAVSPEIFLGESSFMHWWSKYIRIKGASHDSELAQFMKNKTNYQNYAEGDYNFP